jgi:hypothetical protein
MKTIFSRKNRGKNTLYILFAVAILTFAALPFLSHLLSQGIFLLILTLTLLGMMFLGGLIIQMRSGPPW